MGARVPDEGRARWNSSVGSCKGGLCIEASEASALPKLVTRCLAQSSQGGDTHRTSPCSCRAEISWHVGHDLSAFLRCRVTMRGWAQAARRALCPVPVLAGAPEASAALAGVWARLRAWRAQMSGADALRRRRSHLPPASCPHGAGTRSCSAHRAMPHCPVVQAKFPWWL